MDYQKNSKAFFRRGKAQLELKNIDESLEDLQKAAELEPLNASITTEISKAKKELDKLNEKQKVVYSGMFSKLKQDKEDLYQPEPEPKTKKCTICNEEVETVQYARHVIKKHSSK